MKSDNKKEDSKVVGLMDLLLIADQTREIAYVFQIKPNASMLVGV